jgi:broad specificity phosphatase PhoE
LTARGEKNPVSEIYCIRHAQASFGTGDYDRLSEVGMRQAQILADYLLNLGVRFHALYSGSLQRQISTAEPIVSGLSKRGMEVEIQTDPAFNEYDTAGIIRTLAPTLSREDPAFSRALPDIFGDRHAFQMVLEKAMKRWTFQQDAMGDIESWPAFAGRVRRGIDRIVRETGRGKAVALLTSGGPLSVIMQMALRLSDEETLQLAWQIRNASVSLFKFNDDRLTLAAFNGVGHLEIQQDSGLLTYR